MVALLWNLGLGNSILHFYDDFLGTRIVCGYEPAAGPPELEILLGPKNSRRRFVGVYVHAFPSRRLLLGISDVEALRIERQPRHNEP